MIRRTAAISIVMTLVLTFAGFNAVTMADENDDPVILTHEAGGGTVSNGGYADKVVAIAVSNIDNVLSGSAKITLNGLPIMWPLDGTLERSGKYEIVLFDYDTYKPIRMSFAIDREKPVFDVTTTSGRVLKSGDESGEKVHVSIVESNLKSKRVTLNGIVIKWPAKSPKYASFTDAGDYMIKVTDKAGNRKNFKFTIN